MQKDAADTLGIDGLYVDPLWRITVRLTPLERDLLRTWWVRRLGFVAHAGAATVTTTQSYSRLTHSLGLLSLVAHFAEDDEVARAAALVHDIGHPPFSHTFEGVHGLDHHVLGTERLLALGDVFARHGVDAEEVDAVERGRVPSALHGLVGPLRLDHLDSFVRSGRSHGRTRESPPETLTRLRLLDGVVDTDAGTAAYLRDLVEAEARAHCSPANVVATGVMRHLAETLLEDLDDASRRVVAAMTDDEFWTLLLADPRTAEVATSLRRDPAAWRVRPGGPGVSPAAGEIPFTIRRLYLDLPLVDGRPFPPGEAPDARLSYLLSRGEH
ncbi:HD domain-containing protein [Frondihabitans sp. 762G35]|uniref:HD domain-containing protein n=1 Tax=Frondihabitans sp. 762G35 TaxID=1446794 RepID=UPI0013DD4E04|nr:HD domain-containing protein [Frondihabitans sp. 762G35]